MSDNKKRILCVDDDEANLDILEIYLEETYVVDKASNGQECLESIERQKPDLILLDVMMPVMDGKEVCKKLKDSASTRFIPIIVLSAQSYEEDLREMFELGIDSYLTKPFKEARLLKVVADYLSV